MDAEIRVILADDHPVVRQGLRQTIDNDQSVKVIAEAGNGRQALELIRQHRPDVAVLDIDMPEMDGLSVARAIVEEKLPLQVIFLTVHREQDVFDEAVKLDVKGYILKDTALVDILNGIKAVVAGKLFISPDMTAHLLDRQRRTAGLIKEKPGLQLLTPTERRVLGLIADYKSNKEIAAALFISPRTVDTHRANICQKLDIQGRHALMKFALTHKSELS